MVGGDCSLWRYACTRFLCMYFRDFQDKHTATVAVFASSRKNKMTMTIAGRATYTWSIIPPSEGLARRVVRWAMHHGVIRKGATKMQRFRDEALRQISSSAPRIRGGALKPEARVVGAASENRRPRRGSFRECYLSIRRTFATGQYRTVLRSVRP